MYEKAFHKEDLSKYSFLVSGGCGFIGSNIVEYLLKYNAGKVVVLDNLSNGFYKNIEGFQQNPSFEFVKGDIRDLETCRKASRSIDFILHQAALGSVPRSIKDPLTTNEVNINGFLNILVSARENKVKRVVYAASSSTYGDSTHLPKKEDHIGKPLSPYAITKLVNELYAQNFESIYGLDCVGLRYFNVFGPRQDPKGAYAAVIPLFIDSVVNHTPPQIFGDGNQTRDFTFVENAVEANIKAALSKTLKSESKVYNVACGERTSIIQLFNIIKNLASSNLEPVFVPERPGDIRDSLADISKAGNDFGYHPKIDIHKGLQLTYEWYLKNQDFINR